MTAVVAATPPAAAPDVETAISASDLVRRFRNGRGVGPLSLHVRRGECLGLMGPNGAGKTTLLRLLATVDAPQHGEIAWIGSISRRSARREIGYAPDVVAEEPCLTARQSTHFWCRQWLQAGAAGERVSAALSAFDLAAVADEPVQRFSFGMRRRLALAQALVHEPLLALFDEPTAGLDPAGVECLTTVLAQRRGRGAVTVLASNDCNLVAATCDRVLFIDAGRALRDGSPGSLLQEVGQERVAELEVAAACDLTALRAVPGAGSVAQQDGVVTVELLDPAALPAVVAMMDRPAGNLRGMRLRTPDLSDVFWHMTGRALGQERPRR